MTVKDVKEAWNIANVIFPTDYELDKQASEKAGYSIYRSTVKESSSWISDLGTRLEINLCDGRTFNIWIDAKLSESETRIPLLRKYFVYVDSGDTFFKTAVPARSEKDVREYVAGNGEVIAIKDMTDCFPISASHVAEALKAYGFGMDEVDLIVRTLMRTFICNCG